VLHEDQAQGLYLLGLPGIKSCYLPSPSVLAVRPCRDSADAMWAMSPTPIVASLAVPIVKVVMWAHGPSRKQHLCNLPFYGMQAMKVASTAAELWQATKSMAPLTLGIDEAHAMVCYRPDTGHHHVWGADMRQDVMKTRRMAQA